MVSYRMIVYVLFITTTLTIIVAATTTTITLGRNEIEQRI